MTEEFSAFNYVLRYCRPELSEYQVYEVDAGLPDDQSLVMRAAVFEDNKMTSDPYVFIIAKLWVVENIENILKLVPEMD